MTLHAYYLQVIRNVIIFFTLTSKDCEIMKNAFLLCLLLFSLFILQACSNDPIEIDGDKEKSLQHQENDQTLSDTSNQSENQNASNNEYKRIPVQLSKPVDGDTIDVIYNGSVEKVRFLLVDTPETSHPRLGKQPYGQEAKQFTTKLVENVKQLELEFDIGQNRDKYGRLLAYIYADGKMVQEELLKNGFARVAYIYAPNTRYVDHFRNLQADAQKKAIGIWEVENYVQEDGFHSHLITGSSQENNKPTEKNSDVGNKDSCTIKGNINSKGEKIYHTEKSPSYKITKPEAWFCTENEALEAGFRPLKTDKKIKKADKTINLVFRLPF